MSKVKVKQIKSGIKRLQNEALGLRGIGKEVTHEATPNILGMIKKVEHLVSVTEQKGLPIKMQSVLAVVKDLVKVEPLHVDIKEQSLVLDILRN